MEIPMWKIRHARAVVVEHSGLEEHHSSPDIQAEAEESTPRSWLKEEDPVAKNGQRVCLAGPRRRPLNAFRLCAEI